MTNGTFKLGTFRRGSGPSFVGLVVGDHALEVASEGRCAVMGPAQA
jgi:hypothetical protein